jgi:alpha-glucan, water dikinase
MRATGADLDTSMTMARGALPGDLQWAIDDLLTNRNEWWVPGKIVEVREQLSPVWRGCEDASSQRSLLLLDISLEAFLRTRIEASTGGIDSMSGAQLGTASPPL